MDRVKGKVALITGAARGQGRAHAKRLAEEGADIVAVDICADIDNLGYPLGSSEELAETVRIVENEDRRIIARRADVRDGAALQAVVDEAVAEFGGIDIVCANAGLIDSVPKVWEITEEMWDVQIDTMLKGVWNTVRAAVPVMIESGRGGSIIITSSLVGLKGTPHTGAYSAAKAGDVGLAQSLAAEVAPYGIRVNTVHPTAVDTDILMRNEPMQTLFRADLGGRVPTREEFAEACAPMNLLPIPWIEARDVSNAVLFLASDESRYVTGLRMSVDAGALIK
ncbi:mycofactocin-coupled SDR family oxidoreductase [Pseudonocardia sp.]|uniref:mycofactocin-coupled SDR family oxidoreductase n=1 Tax=Pseudonocardia sp. TaxID=60912 RepID=UPI003D095FAB